MEAAGDLQERIGVGRKRKNAERTQPPGQFENGSAYLRDTEDENPRTTTQPKAKSMILEGMGRRLVGRPKKRRGRKDTSIRRDRRMS